MPSGQEIGSRPVNHPRLGPGQAILANRRLALAGFFLDAAFIAIAVMGFLLGLNDLQGGGTSLSGLAISGPVMGLAQIAAAALVAVWAVRAARVNLALIRRSSWLVIARDGFEYVNGNGPVLWSEVEAIRDPAADRGAPLALKVQLSDPADYVSRHKLSPVARVELRLNRNLLVLGRTTVMPVQDVQTMMRKRLSESQGADRVAPTPADSRAPKRRRRAAKQ